MLDGSDANQLVRCSSPRSGVLIVAIAREGTIAGRGLRLVGRALHGGLAPGGDTPRLEVDRIPLVVGGMKSNSYSFVRPA